MSIVYIFIILLLQVETAGSEGFLILLPIYLDHIFFPTLADEAFKTEVHHINGTGDDAGVVYCEMQARENNAESREEHALQAAVVVNDWWGLVLYQVLCNISSSAKLLSCV